MEPACPNVTISQVGPEMQRQFFSEEADRKSVRRSQKEVSHAHLVPEGLLPRAENQRKSCTALTKSSEEAALPCPAEKQRRSCPALNEKQRNALLAESTRRQERWWKNMSQYIIHFDMKKQTKLNFQL